VSAPAGVPHAGTYRRELPVSLDRLYENALDWEHLPYLHRTTFSSIAVIEAGSWGWRADVGLQPSGPGHDIVLELTLDRDCRRWITRTLAGPGTGTEIWTHAFREGDRRTDVVVDFFTPGIDRDDLARVGAFYCDLYARLYDEDVWMMTVRQDQLDGTRDHPTRTVEIDGEVVTFSAVCPHLLGPLDDATICDGIVECPWHGYRYDIRTGQEVTGRRLRLRPVTPPARTP
jgi:nitrite reductase/ring-hydroxylating ferredoxin subunit